jgi:putative ABC transport system ATP-binding protein
MTVAVLGSVSLTVWMAQRRSCSAWGVGCRASRGVQTTDGGHPGRFGRNDFRPRSELARLAFRTRDDGPVLFELEDVTATRAGRVVFEGVRAGLADGATGIVGPSGVGKSTLLRLLNRLADPAAGTVRYRGRDLRENEVLALRRDVGLVPQLPALLEGTVAENVLYGPRLAQRDSDVTESLRLAGLDPAFGPRPADALSVGEQQRVMLARTLALQPSVLLLDEPTSALDDTTKAAIEATLRDLRARLGLSFVLVTHDVDQAARLADRVLVLEPGALREAPAAATPER